MFRSVVDLFFTVAVRSRGGSLRGSAGDLSTAGLSDGRNTPKAVRRKSNRVPTRPLIERQKRTSDDENDDGASNISETPTDGTDGSATDGSSYNALVAHRLSGELSRWENSVHRLSELLYGSKFVLVQGCSFQKFLGNFR